MPLFTRGTETVEVFPAVDDIDEWGNQVVRPGDPDRDTPILVKNCLVQPSTEDADSSQGYSILSVYRVLCDVWPSQAKAVVRWRGQLWDSRSNPARRRYGHSTSHDTAIIIARNEEEWANNG